MRSWYECEIRRGSNKKGKKESQVVAHEGRNFSATYVSDYSLSVHESIGKTRKFLNDKILDECGWRHSEIRRSATLFCSFTSAVREIRGVGNYLDQQVTVKSLRGILRKKICIEFHVRDPTDRRPLLLRPRPK